MSVWQEDEEEEDLVALLNSTPEDAWCRCRSTTKLCARALHTNDPFLLAMLREEEENDNPVAANPSRQHLTTPPGPSAPSKRSDAFKLRVETTRVPSKATKELLASQSALIDQLRQKLHDKTAEAKMWKSKAKKRSACCDAKQSTIECAAVAPNTNSGSAPFSRPGKQMIDQLHDEIAQLKVRNQRLKDSNTQLRQRCKDLEAAAQRHMTASAIQAQTIEHLQLKLRGKAHSKPRGTAEPVRYVPKPLHHRENGATLTPLTTSSLDKKRLLLPRQAAPSVREGEGEASTPAMIVRSVREAAMHMGAVRELILRQSEDLLCRNLMCERVGDACMCRLSIVLEKLPNLTTLDVSANRLPALPPSVFQLGRLEELVLAKNQLGDDVFKDMHNFQRLRRVDLSNNQLTTVPSALAELPNLEMIDVRGNPLTAPLPKLPSRITMLV
ncbi:hypothetical protein Ae201684P_002588 [Aphanomyces euteiches]|uniref:Uncharacterized protein n=1 Tax=Aphanomyces euteiches TaxID=100861 RepID=A0A6G0X207_9STRA|nr:hypothetical protein Ae201684_009401 [Aphanomyces euteiches]KAH9070221.1 hypothetical protein Ae201684P_002588 [Aphanomyces euteiches]